MRHHEHATRLRTVQRACRTAAGEHAAGLNQAAETYLAAWLRYELGSGEHPKPDAYKLRDDEAELIRLTRGPAALTAARALADAVTIDP